MRSSVSLKATKTQSLFVIADCRNAVIAFSFTVTMGNVSVDVNEFENN